MQREQESQYPLPRIWFSNCNDYEKGGGENEVTVPSSSDLVLELYNERAGLTGMRISHSTLFLGSGSRTTEHSCEYPIQIDQSQYPLPRIWFSNQCLWVVLEAKGLSEVTVPSSSDLVLER